MTMGSLFLRSGQCSERERLEDTLLYADDNPLIKGAYVHEDPVTKELTVVVQNCSDKTDAVNNLFKNDLHIHNRILFEESTFL